MQTIGMLKAIRFAVHYWTEPFQNVVLVGDTPLLGSWDVHHGLHLGHLGNGQWIIEVVLPSDFEAEDVEYKYVLVDEAHNVSFWEAGPNHVLSLKHSVVSNGVVELRDTFQVRLSCPIIAVPEHLFHLPSVSPSSTLYISPLPIIHLLKVTSQISAAIRTPLSTRLVYA